MKHVELNISIATVEYTLEYTNFKDNLIEINVCVVTKLLTRLWWKLKRIIF